MAKTSLVCSCVFILVLILCHELSSVEGRHLKCKKSSKHARQMNTLSVPKGGRHHATGSKQAQTSKVEYVDDFRPTAPGHSPGVGHSINN
ncbi:Precursor of CEP8 [Melia azedarach]|uniref:Precursor of CEP8 n=1 Tax=Melia azedarach TaxID=155640 RepID=A0ACC1XU86_MELAZ|nr:Precursor of CEP8 [Melia azedarach]